MEAFHADAMALAKPPAPMERLGMIQRYAVVAPMRASCSGAISLLSQPFGRRTSESVKTITSKFSGERFHRAAQIMHFLAAILGGAGNHDMHGPLAGGFHSLDDFERGIEAGSERKIDLVVRVVKSRERHQIVFKPGLDAFARTNQRRDRRVKSRMRREPSPHQTEPLVTVPERVEPQRDLHHDQKIEKVEHCRENSKKRRAAGLTHALTC